jgi:hypothetical protein
MIKIRKKDTNHRISGLGRGPGLPRHPWNLVRPACLYAGTQPRCGDEARPA